MPFIEVEDIETLRVGVLVRLQGSWFSHPFPSNTFTIKSAKDLATLQSLTNVTILYDPERAQSSRSDDLQGQGDGFHARPTESADPKLPRRSLLGMRTIMQKRRR